MTPFILFIAGLASGIHAAQEPAPVVFRRQAAVRLQNWPSTGARSVRVELEVPREYPITVAPRTSLTPAAADTMLAFSVNPLPDGGHRVTFDALGSKPFDLPACLFTFSFDYSDPEALPVPLVLRHFAILEANMQLSRTAEADVVVQAHPTGRYQPLDDGLDPSP